MKNTFFQKNIVVTGGGSGLGRAFALEGARRGARAVLIADLDEGRSTGVVKELEAHGTQGFFQRCDVTDPGAVEALGQRARELLGRIDYAFNNAGVAAGGPFLETPMADWHWLLGPNLFGIIHGCRTFGTIMKDQGSGHLVNTASLAAYGCLPEMSLYNVSKAGTLMLSETLRAELRPLGINVSVICPAFVKTNLAERSRTPRPEYQRLAHLMLDGSKVMPERIARSVFNQLAHNKLYIFPTWDARLMATLRRLTPGLMIWGIGRLWPRIERFMMARAAKLEPDHKNTGSPSGPS